MNKALIVDDNKQNLYMLQYFLQGNGYKVDCATNGTEALELARKELPNVIISDILMPMMDGFTLCREWKKDDILKSIPFVFYTATYTDPKDEAFALSLGAERFVIKPKDPDEFLKIIAEIITEAEKGKLVAPMEPVEEETLYLKEYNERLVHKLENKMLDLQAALDESIQLQDSLDRRVKELSILNDFGRRVNDSLSLDQVVKTVLGEIGRHLEADAVMLYRLDGDKLILQGTFPETTQFQYAGTKVRCSGQCLCGLAAEGKQIYSKDIHNDPRVTLTECKDAGIKSFVALPLIKGDDILGVLSVASLTKRDFSKQADFLEIISNQAAVGLQNAIIYNKEQEHVSELDQSITQIEKAKFALENSEKKFRAVVETAVSAIISSDSEGKIIFWNKAAEKMFGYAREEIIGKEVKVIMPEKYHSSHLKGLKRVAKTGKTRIVNRPMELAGLRKDGTEFPIELTLSMWKMGQELFFTALISDITERKRAEENVLNLAKFPSENPNPVLRISAEGVILDHNQASLPLLEHLQLSKDSCVSNDWHDIVLDSLASRETRQTEIQFIDRTFSFVFAPIIDSQYVNVYGIDITQLKQAGQERKKLIRVLESKNKELSDIVYVSSHDLKSPLLNINGFSGRLTEHCQQLKELIAKQEDIDGFIKSEIVPLLEEAIPEDLDFICSGSGRMKTLIEGLLRVSRLGTSEIKIEKININKMVAEIIDTVKYQADKGRVTITFAQLPDCVGDLKQIRQVFANLIDNALKYIDPEKKGFAHVSGQVKDEKSIYCVEDNGIGIDQVYSDKIFEIYHRLDPHWHSEGEGLGLTIVRRILDRHNGEIWLESKPGQGSKFFVSLPHELQIQVS